MKYSLTLILAALTGSLFMALNDWSQQPPEPSAYVAKPRGFLQPVQAMPEAGDVSPPEKQQNLNELTGLRLYQTLDQFWHRCAQLDRCDEELALQQSTLEPRIYQLLVHFQDNLQQEKQMLNELLTDHQTLLSDKVQLLRSIRETIWDEEATVLYQDEYLYQDFRLAVMDLQQSVITPDDYLNGIRRLVNEWKSPLESVGLLSDQQAFELASQWIPARFTADEQKDIQAALSETYLSDSQQQAVRTRQLEIEHQQDEVQRYQEGLTALYHELESLRKSTMKSLASEHWQDYKNSRVTQYRRSFFSD